MVNALVLKGFRLFKGLDESQLAEVAEVCTERDMKLGDILFREGTRATDLHLCRRGRVEITFWVGEPWNKNVPVHEVLAGELHGWSAVVAPYTYTSTTECIESGQEILMSGSGMLSLFDRNPPLGLIVMRNLSAEISARLSQTRQRLSIEWLNSVSMPSTEPSAWGEPNRR